MKGVMIRVFCDDKSHPTKRAKLETFVRKEGASEWSLLPVHRREERGTRWSRSLLDENDQLLDEGPDGPGRGAPPVRFRHRYELECPLCERPLQVRSEKLAPILDVLAKHAIVETDSDGVGVGVFAVSLGALAARITSR